MNHYYLVNDEKYVNAIEAWQKISDLTNTGTLTGYELILDNGKFDHYDWLSVPDKSISELEEIRAKQIREKYEYVRVLYSGGSDSFSLLEAFFRSGLTVDELVVYEWRNIDSAFVENNPRVKIRWLNELCAKYSKDVPKTTILTIDNKIINSHFSKNWFLNHLGHAGTQSFSPNHLADLLDYVSEPVGVKSMCTVIGMEKPRVFADKKHVWFQMNDKNTMYSATDKHVVEWFYLSADCLDLVNAQCRGTIQVAKRLLGHIPLHKALTKLQTDVEYYDIWCKSLGRTTTRFQNMCSKIVKNVGATTDEVNTYNHIKSYENTNEWKNYNDYVNAMIDISGKPDLHGILTKKYVLEILETFDEQRK